MDPPGPLPLWFVELLLSTGKTVRDFERLRFEWAQKRNNQKKTMDVNRLTAGLVRMAGYAFPKGGYKRDMSAEWGDWSIEFIEIIEEMNGGELPEIGPIAVPEDDSPEAMTRRAEELLALMPQTV